MPTPLTRRLQFHGGRHSAGVGSRWAKTSFNELASPPFDAYLQQPHFFVVLVLAAETGYRGDIFIFPVKDFARVVQMGIPAKGHRKVYISRVRDEPDRWVLRRKNKFTEINGESVVDVSRYRRNFSLLLSSQ